MFGGLMFMVRGRMCISVGRDRLMCRIDPARHDAALERKGCRTMTMNGRQYRGYVHVDRTAVTSSRDLAYWIRLALDYKTAAQESMKAASSAARGSADRLASARGASTARCRHRSGRRMRPPGRTDCLRIVAPRRDRFRARVPERLAPTPLQVYFRNRRRSMNDGLVLDCVMSNPRVNVPARVAGFCDICATLVSQRCKVVASGPEDCVRSTLVLLQPVARAHAGVPAGLARGASAVHF
jgi:TfoX/Sxy family transcriptional regulator of competence genes